MFLSIKNILILTQIFDLTVSPKGEKGVDIETVRDLLGHHCITITQRYTHSNDERKRVAVELLSREVEGKICDVFVTQENQSELIN